MCVCVCVCIYMRPLRSRLRLYVCMCVCVYVCVRTLNVCADASSPVPRVETKGLTTFVRHNKACIFFLVYIPKLGFSSKIPTQYSEIQIVARDFHSNRLKSEDPENTDSVY